MNTRFVLVIGAILIAIGILKPDLSNINFRPVVNPDPVTTINVIEPTDEKLKEAALVVKNILKNGGGSHKKDALLLSGLYKDLAALIAMDGANTVVKTTDEIREANSVSGKLMNLDLKDKYDNLAEACNNVIVLAIGDDNVLVSQEIRSKAVAAFSALSWACYEGAK